MSVKEVPITTPKHSGRCSALVEVYEGEDPCFLYPPVLRGRCRVACADGQARHTNVVVAAARLQSRANVRVDMGFLPQGV